MPPWDPEHPVDEARARELIAGAWPDLAGAPLAHVGSGWDVDVWRAGELAVRFPRRALGIACLDNELRVLPRVVDRVPAPVPRPLRVGAPALGYPARFYAHAWLPGATALRAGLDEDARARLAAPLGRFLRALHATPLDDAFAPDARGDAAAVAARGRERLAGLALDPALAARAEAILAAPPALDVAPVVVHGDLHAGNLLVDDGGLRAVIDWGDCGAGDPAIDLAIGWSLVPPRAREDFLAAYGAVTAATWARARVNALSRHGLAILAWGRDLGDAAVVRFADSSVGAITG